MGEMNCREEIARSILCQGLRDKMGGDEVFASGEVGEGARVEWANDYRPRIRASSLDASRSALRAQTLTSYRSHDKELPK
jgi:hypothetical protein